MARQHAASVLAAALLVGVLASIPTEVQSIGVCYGVNGDVMPMASDVVKLYLASGITGMRIYFPDTNALQALSGSNINLIIDVGNDQLSNLASGVEAASSWVEKNIQPYPDVTFRYIAVGNEVPDSDTHLILPAMQNVDAALSAAGIGGIKVSTAVYSGVTQGFPPSLGTFSASYMGPIAQYLASTGAPLLANVYPYFSFVANQATMDIRYALFTSSGTVVTDGSNSYQNLFDAMVDTFHYALESAGAGSVGVVVSESGWPSGGGAAATLDNAGTYVQSLVKHVSKGTPKMPQPLETYIFAMFNENKKTGLETEKHFGLFNPDMSAVYPIDFAEN
ncbi:unnamed protein product [Alopecurus aequalis]